MDGTLGGGGHTNAILLQAENVKVFGFDKDSDAHSFAGNRLKSFKENFQPIKDDFKNAPEVLKGVKLDGVLLDLGISSHQIDMPERGFSYRFDAPLDMRMNQEQDFSAYDIINNYTEEQLLKILWEYGEENFARRIVKNILDKRKKAAIKTTGELVKIIQESVPAFTKGGHPAKKTFQALRIEVNSELTGLFDAIIEISKLIEKGGRFCIITFHSLEDRIVKQSFKLLTTDCICDKSLPICICKHQAEFKQYTNKPIEASDKELQENTRSASAKLRVIEKL